MTLLLQKYQPNTSQEIIGQDLPLAQLKDFITNYKRKKNKLAVLVGPIGTGKTAAVHALAKEYKADLLELNASDVRNQKNIEEFLDKALGQHSLFFSSKIILIDEIDCISGVRDRGCIPALLKATEKSVFPIILTANSLEDKKLKALQKKADIIAFDQASNTVIGKYLTHICTNEKILHEDKALASLARQCDGDLRAALLDLDVCSARGKITFEDVINLPPRKRTQTIMQALLLIFKSSQAATARQALFNVDLNSDEIFLWLDENIPKEYTKAEDLHEAYTHLTRADVFRQRIRRRQHWRFLAYINELLSAGISSAKSQKNPKNVTYRQTMRLLKIWQANMKYAKRKEITKKIAARLNISQKRAIEQVSLLQTLLQTEQKEQLIKEFELTPDELLWLEK